MASHVLGHAARRHVRERVGVRRHAGPTMTGRLNRLADVASMWRGDVQRAAESRRLLAGAALDAMEQGHTVQEVADTIGWSQRASVYNLLKEFHHA